MIKLREVAALRLIRWLARTQGWVHHMARRAGGR